LTVHKSAPSIDPEFQPEKQMFAGHSRSKALFHTPAFGFASRFSAKKLKAAILFPERGAAVRHLFSNGVASIKAPTEFLTCHQR